MNEDSGREQQEMPGLFDFICFAVYSVNHAFGRTYKPLLDELGLTYPQYLVMVVLWDNDGQSVGAIGQKLFLESNTLTPLLKRLEGLGYVTRTRASHDERQVIVQLTQTGRALRTKAVSVPQCIVEAMGLDLETVGRIRDDLVDLRSRLFQAGTD
ncbi:MarR family winged helix-turn-helix transcriptional regulator [Rubellimicrobium arenae]|uniref:MarR family winged helix-turn-helix transcriptional regulator n=1 Tax=Rubellimicrobium arenae TaxID=2817372 RepID=UPI001FEECCD0|nr:MarR family transcriptional regulator [Rubellimicrobium arenae]